jgi:hypothetical protein
MTADVAAPGLCKAWVNFNGTGTVAIRAAFNVSSITDNGTGQYAVNFTVAMADVNYCVTGASSTNGTTNGVLLAAGNTGNSTTSASALVLDNASTNLMDAQAVYVAIFR